MKFETRRERETRRKRQKQSAILGMVLAFALVMIMGAVIWSGKRTLEKQNKEYQAQPFPEFLQKMIQANGLVNYVNEKKKG